MTQTRLIDEIAGVGTTNAGSTVTLITATPPNNINSLVFLWVLATAAGNERASWFRTGSIHKDGGGTITIDTEADLSPSFTTNGIKHATIASVISGASIRLDVTGDPDAGDISWQAIARFFRS